MRASLAIFALCLVQYVGGIREENSRSSYFNALPKHRLTGHVIKTTTADSMLSCAQKCLAHDACKSCNFKRSGKHRNCELNSRGHLSQTHDLDLAHDEEIVFLYVDNEPPLPAVPAVKEHPGSFKLFQTFPTSRGMAVTTFVINDELFLASTNMYSVKDSWGPARLSVYLLQKNNLVINQTLGTLSASGVEHFTIDGEHFLAVANNNDGRSHNVDSIVYRWEAGHFKTFQRIPTDGALGFHYFAVNERKFLLTTSAKLISIYEWKNGNFGAKIQDISKTYFYRCNTFTIKNKTFMACGKGQKANATSVFKWSGSRFEVFQILSSSFVYGKPHSFNANGILYLAVANYYPHDTDSYIYRWDGANFVHHQSIPTHGARALYSFATAEGDVFLIVANQYTGGNDKYHTKSAVYKMADNKFNLYQELPTTGAWYAHAFTYKGKQYLAVVNNYSGTTYRLDSQVYIWD